ncbi:hypothetical protein ACFQ68_07440 [Amycolatopsis japonica]
MRRPKCPPSAAADARSCDFMAGSSSSARDMVSASMIASAPNT